MGEYTKTESWKMFDAISKSYDFLNRLLSFGLDIRWRKEIVRYLPQNESLKILDVATGTADVPIFLARQCRRINHIEGVDLSAQMLAIGREKINEEGLSEKITLRTADAHQLPFEDAVFDTATIAFGIRNLGDPQGALREMHRVLKAGGKALILEFSVPENEFIRPVHRFYMRHVMPAVGAAVSGDLKAYRYLDKTVEAFPYGKEFCDIIEKAGFHSCRAHSLTMDTAMIYEA